MLTLNPDGRLMGPNGPAIPPVHTAAEVAWHIRELRKQFNATIETPGGLAGDGIVTTTLGKRYAIMGEITRRMVRETDPTTPLQIWHDGLALGRKDEEKGRWGDGEKEVAAFPFSPSPDPAYWVPRPLPPSYSRMGSDPHTTYIDIRQFPARNFQWAGFSWKSFAALNSGFRRVLFLDADAYPVQPLKPLFDLLDGVSWVLWSGPGRRLASYQALWTGIAKPPIPPDTQGGQWLVDLSRAYKELAIMAWIDAHGDYFYQVNRWHDEGTSRMVLSEMETPYRRMHADYSRVMICRSPANEPLIIHRIWAKLWPDCVPHWDHALPKEATVIKHFRELAGAGYRRAVFGPCPRSYAIPSPNCRAAAIRRRRERGKGSRGEREKSK